MTPDQRAAVVANAKYLRRVRPIEPGEIYEYVDGRPHPAAVRQVLREEAVGLGLVERDDGAFVPVSDEPVPGLAGAVERLPDRYGRRLDALLVDRYGPDWADGESGDRLREVIRGFKEEYYRGRTVEYDRDVALGYAVYHLAGYYAAIQYVLDDVAERGLVPRRLRVLDVGAGVGGPALGLFDALPPDALVEYHAVEPSAAADVFEALIDEVGRNVHATVHRTTAEAFDPDGPYDLVMFANVLSELADPAATVNAYADSVAADGTMLLLAPADRETSIGLRAVERAAVDRAGLTVYAPTLRLWPDAEPSDRCWSFDVRPDLAVPAVQRRLDRRAGATGEFVNVDVQFSYAILRPDGKRRIEFVPDASRFARMADTERHVTDRIDCVGVKLSRDLGGNNPVFLVGDGSQRVDHYAVLTRPTGLNRDLREAEYGDLLVFEGVLALWNDDEEAYNLVVDGETAVDGIG